MIQREIKINGQPIQLTLRNEGDFIVANELFLDRQYRFCEEAIKKAGRLAGSMAMYRARSGPPTKAGSMAMSGARSGPNSIIDIGGHLGFFSLLASTLNPTVPIYTFEPHAGNFKILKTNLKQNRIKNVFPKQLAVSDSVGETHLRLSKEDLNHSLEKAIEPTGETQKIQTTTVQGIFEKNKLGRCDLLKLDCEGSEFKIIYSTPGSLFSKIDHIFLEYHDWTEGENSQELKSFLERRGYRVQQYPNAKMPELGFLWCIKP